MNFQPRTSSHRLCRRRRRLAHDRARSLGSDHPGCAATRPGLGARPPAAFTAGVGHVVSTLIIASVIWFAGVAVAAKFGHFIDTAASIALIGFGGWIAISSWRELSRGGGHGHSHRHGHGHGHSRMKIYLFYLARAARGYMGRNCSASIPPAASSSYRFSNMAFSAPLSAFGPEADRVSQVETLRQSGAWQVFPLAKRGAFWGLWTKFPSRTVLTQR